MRAKHAASRLVGMHRNRALRGVVVVQRIDRAVVAAGRTVLITRLEGGAAGGVGRVARSIGRIA